MTRTFTSTVLVVVEFELAEALLGRVPQQRPGLESVVKSAIEALAGEGEYFVSAVGPEDGSLFCGALKELRGNA